MNKRKSAKQLLQEYNKVVESTDDMITVVDREYRCLHANHAYLKQRGMKREELLGLSISEVLGAEVFESVVKEKLDECFQGKIVRYEIREQYPKLGERDMLVSFFPIEGSEGVDRAVCLLQDITERKRAESENSRLAGIVNASDDAIFLATREGLIATWNAGAERMYGYSAEEITGKHISILVPGDRHGELAANRERLYRGEAFVQYGFEHMRKDGSRLQVSETLSPIKDATGVVTGISVISRDITEGKRAQEALIEERHLLHTLMDNLPDLIYFKDRESRFTRTNKAHANLFGLSDPVLAIDKTDFDFYAPEQAIAFRKDEHEIIRTGQPVVGKEEMQRWPDGHVTWVSTTKMPLRDAQGNIIGTFGVSRDITERKHVEEALRESEEKYHSLVSNIPDVAWTVDAERRFVFIGKGIERITGYSLEEAYQGGVQFYLDSLHPDDVPLTRNGFRALFAEGRPFDVESRLKRKDGEWIWVHYRALASYERNGIRHADGLLSDITERKQAEAEHVRLVTAIEQSAEAVVITNTNGDIEYVNPAFTRITGYSREEVLGQNPRILKSDTQDPAFYQQLWASILKGEIWHGEIVNRRKDGELYTEEMNITPVRDARGAVTHFIATKQDVTERRRLEKQFRQAQKMEAVGRLAGGVAHDFNNLLTIINGYSDLVLDRLNPDDPNRAHIGEIKKAGDQAASLTRQLLAFSRQQVLALQILDLNALVAHVQKMLRRLIGEDIDLAVVRDPSLGQVKADAGQIEQILMNLAVNARDAMPEGGKLVIETANAELDDAYVCTHPLVVPGRYVMLAVSDTGMGIDAQTQAHIFEPFFTTKELGKGTGLGLAMVYGIVKQSGGYIWVYSEPGQGATFKIYLPRVDEVAESIQASKMSSHSLAGSETILLVEDEEAVRALAAKVLEERGYKVLESTSPEDALQIGERHKEPVHLLLTDVVLPRMSGRKIAEHLALLRPGMKVLYMSGYTDDSVVRQGVLEANTAFLQKPFTPASLARKVREVLDTGREARS
jgi:PAS domain S-box-containing protein